MNAEDKVITAKWMEKQDIILAGRCSEWEYYNSDHAFLAGKKAAEKVYRQMESLTAAVQSGL